MILLGVFLIIAVVCVLVAIAAAVERETRRLPPPPPDEIPSPRQPQLQQPTQKRIQKRPRHVEPPAPTVGAEKNIRLYRRIKKREGALSPNARCRVTQRLVLECNCENRRCRELRAKYGV
jgi:hypothetical protein